MRSVPSWGYVSDACFAYLKIFVTNLPQCSLWQADTYTVAFFFIELQTYILPSTTFLIVSYLNLIIKENVWIDSLSKSYSPVFFNWLQFFKFIQWIIWYYFYTIKKCTNFFLNKLNFYPSIHAIKMKIMAHYFLY